MTKRKTKATYHSGRPTKAGKIYNANHNTRKKTRDGQGHIDHELMKNNLLYRIENNKVIPCKSEDSFAFEKKRYKELFEEKADLSKGTILISLEKCIRDMEQILFEIPGNEI